MYLVPKSPGTATRLGKGLMATLVLPRQPCALLRGLPEDTMLALRRMAENEVRNRM